jgi:hypothetical protein
MPNNNTANQIIMSNLEHDLKAAIRSAKSSVEEMERFLASLQADVDVDNLTRGIDQILASNVVNLAHSVQQDHRSQNHSLTTAVMHAAQLRSRA